MPHFAVCCEGRPASGRRVPRTGPGGLARLNSVGDPLPGLPLRFACSMVLCTHWRRAPVRLGPLCNVVSGPEHWHPFLRFRLCRLNTTLLRAWIFTWGFCATFPQGWIRPRSLCYWWAHALPPPAGAMGDGWVAAPISAAMTVVLPASPLISTPIRCVEAAHMLQLCSWLARTAELWFRLA